MLEKERRDRGRQCWSVLDSYMYWCGVSKLLLSQFSRALHHNYPCDLMTLFGLIFIKQYPRDNVSGMQSVASLSCTTLIYATISLRLFCSDEKVYRSTTYRVSQGCLLIYE